MSTESTTGSAPRDTEIATLRAALAAAEAEVADTRALLARVAEANRGRGERSAARAREWEEHLRGLLAEKRAAEATLAAQVWGWAAVATGLEQERYRAAVHATEANAALRAGTGPLLAEAEKRAAEATGSAMRATARALTAENERDAARAEVERLTADRDEWCKWAGIHKQVATERGAEVERLRAEREGLALELEGISDELPPRQGEGLRDAVIRLQRERAADIGRVAAERDGARAQAASAERGRAEAERRLEKQRHELETAHRWLDAHLSREAPPEANAPKAGVTQWRGRIEDDNGDGSVIARMWKISDCAEFLITLPPAVLRGQKWRPGSAVDLWEWLPDGAWCVVDAEADERNLLRVRCDMLRAEVERLSSPAVPQIDGTRQHCPCGWLLPRDPQVAPVLGRSPVLHYTCPGCGCRRMVDLDAERAWEEFQAAAQAAPPAVPRGLTEEERADTEMTRRMVTAGYGPSASLARRVLTIIDRLTAEAPRTPEET